MISYRLRVLTLACFYRQIWPFVCERETLPTQTVLKVFIVDALQSDSANMIDMIIAILRVLWWTTRTLPEYLDLNRKIRCLLREDAKGSATSESCGHEPENAVL